MKKIYSFMLVLITLFTCVVFSACGDKYKKLSISIYSSSGSGLDSLNFVIDSSRGETPAQTIKINFDGIDKDEVGQIIVYSIPNELITASNYVYGEKTCSVQIKPNMPSGNDAKLVVSHLASGKQKSIPLKIEQKSESVVKNATIDNYVVSIPESGLINSHIVDLSKVFRLLPAGSTDKIYFKLKEGTTLPAGVEPVQPDNFVGSEKYGDVYSGVKISHEAIHGASFEVFPVTVINGYEYNNEVDKFKDLLVSIHLQKILNVDNWTVVPEDGSYDNIDLEDLQLVVNDSSASSFKLKLQTLDNTTEPPTMANLGDYFNYYKIELNVKPKLEEDKNKISAEVDISNNIFIASHSYTKDNVVVEIVLKPKNSVGDIVAVSKEIIVKATSKPNAIEVKNKKGEVLDLEDYIDIYDYINENDTRGILFKFNPISLNGGIPDDRLTTMRLIVSPEILNATGDESDVTANVVYEDENFVEKADLAFINSNNIRTSSEVLSIYQGNYPLDFYLETGRLISRPFTSNADIYIKYVETGKPNASTLSLKIETIKNDDIPQNWSGISSASATIKFNHVKGVKSVQSKAAFYYNGTYKDYDDSGSNNDLFIDVKDTTATKLLYFKDVKDQDDQTINTNVNFRVEVDGGNKSKPLKIAIKLAGTNPGSFVGTNSVVYTYSGLMSNFASSNLVVLLVDEDTSLGSYKIKFYQGDELKQTVNCSVFKGLTAISDSMIKFGENDDKILKNTDPSEFDGADYIVASHQDPRRMEIKIGQEFIDSNITNNEKVTFDFYDNKKEYFDVKKNANNANLYFKKGTYDASAGGEFSVSLTISLEVNTSSTVNIPGTAIYDITKAPNVSTDIFKVIKFYIYEEINKENISLSNTYRKFYAYDKLGYFYKTENKSNFDLSLIIKDKTQNDITDGMLNFATSNLKWFVCDENGIVTTSYTGIYKDGSSEWNATDMSSHISKTLPLLFKHRDKEQNGYRVIIKVEFEQFSKKFELECVVDVVPPVLTEKVEMESPLHLDYNNKPNINLKKGDYYQIEAKNLSSKGKVSFEELYIVVVDDEGFKASDDVFDIDQDLLSIKFKETANSTNYKNKNFKVIVFAKDVLTNGIEATFGFNNPKNKILAGYGYEPWFIFDVILSDGTEGNEYCIYNADDFWNIPDNEDAHYKLMDDINLEVTKAQKEKISNFRGKIVTYDNQTFTIYGIKLDNSLPNLFYGFNGEIQQVIFEVNYSYSDKYGNLGVFDVNEGTLTNVGVVVSGSASIADDVNFGGLVGVNEGEIKFVNDATDRLKAVVGSRGYITVNGNGYFGGLVGKNLNLISGCETATGANVTNEYVLSVKDGYSNAISLINITSDGGVVIGGVVGLNTYDTGKGKIENVYAQATIDAKNNSNVGGVVGENKQEKVGLEFTSLSGEIGGVAAANTYHLKNVKSASIVYGNENVGGIVGYDTNGYYYECDYQSLYLETDKQAILATKNAGGIAGYSDSGIFWYCSVMSYKLDYSKVGSVVVGGASIEDVVKGNLPDIEAETYVGGIVGFAENSDNTLDIASAGTTIDNRVRILYSSVNAYIKATETDSEIGGILSSDGSGMAIVYNAYFIGVLDGNCEDNLCIGSKESSIKYNFVYSINLKNTTNKIYSYKGGSESNRIEFTTPLDKWGQNNNLNGGYIFVTSNGTLPIFDVAPESITTTVKDESLPELKHILRLYYYDFSSNPDLTDENLVELNEAFNYGKVIYESGNVNSLIEIVAKPSDIGTIIISVRSSNSKIIEIDNLGKINIKGVGTCELIFESPLNPNATDKITVIVDYPVGDTLKISKSNNAANVSQIVSDATEKLAPGTSKEYFVVTSGKKLYTLTGTSNQRYFAYKTKTDFNLRVNVEGDPSALSNLLISGNEVTVNPINITKNTPFLLTVLKQVDNQTGKDYAFEIYVTPFIEINGKTIDFDQTSFNLSTLMGVSNVSFSYDNAVVYPNDTVYVTLNLTTDVEVENTLSEHTIADVKAWLNEYGLSLDVDTSITNYEIYIESLGGLVGNNQRIQLRIEFKDLEIKTEEKMIWEISTNYNTSARLEYLVIPQRISGIEFKNYYYNNDGQLVLKDILQQRKQGYLALNLVPNNGYYSYFEISDVTGDQEILFVQMDGIGESANRVHSDIINKPVNKLKLYPVEGQSKDKIYVSTIINAKYDSKSHRIKVTAYSEEDVELGSFYHTIEVRMLPEISAYYTLPNGKLAGVVGSLEGQAPKNTEAIYLANGVQANIRVETKHATAGEDGLDYKISALNSAGTLADTALASKYEFVHDANEHYVLKLKSTETVDASDVGKKLILTLTAKQTLYNDSTTCEFVFTITNFVIHDISVNSSYDGPDGSEINGYYTRKVKLEFYFDEEDISYYHGANGYWNTEYVYEDGISELPDVAANNDLKQIYTILEEINNTDNYFKLRYWDESSESFNDADRSHENFDNITWSEHWLDVTNEDADKYNKDKPIYLSNLFRLVYESDESGEWKIKEHNYTPTDQDPYYDFSKDYKINFITAPQWFEPLVVNSEEDFLKMEKLGQYILNKDLEFDYYVPMDVELIEFDGNGHTIKIKGFDEFKESDVQAGLFKQVYENMIVKNVKVVYESQKRDDGSYSLGNVGKSVTYSDFCKSNEVAYSSVNFGGLAAVNNGIITNCVVTGSIAMHASYFESRLAESSGQTINFNIGGFVATNSSGGYITNSLSELQIYALANIGGFVYSNAGKIVSCAVDNSATIYAYNANLGNSIAIEAAGFAVVNSKEISMSYVNLNSKTNANNIKTGRFYVKDTSAGFVYTNTGKVSDAYVKISELSQLNNNNTFYGFVFVNSGNIARAYTLINQGVLASSYIFMFAPKDSTESENPLIENCIEFIKEDHSVGYSNGVDGLTTVFIQEDNGRSSYLNKNVYLEHEFAFGDNKNSIWKINNGTPQLISTTELLFDDFIPLTITCKDGEIINGVEQFTYNTNYAYYGTKQNPFIVHNLETWNLFMGKISDYNVQTAYFRIVQDFSFIKAGDAPISASQTFKGNIQGNNMQLVDIMLRSTTNLKSVGLFASLSSAKDRQISNSVRNLKLSASSVWASSTEAVGLLAGIIEDFNIYNIHIDRTLSSIQEDNYIFVGQNVVGGLAGIIRGDFNVEYVSSNVGANSTRVTTRTNYSVYMSKVNGFTASQNIKNVYYAGSIAGVVDAYDKVVFDITAERDINDYNKISNVIVKDQITILGDTVGGAFGFVGEKVHLSNAYINITSGSLVGTQYTAGVVGENRGIITNSKVNLPVDLFARVEDVAAGVVGLNLGGLVEDVAVTAFIHLKVSENKETVGGIVGRNIYGTILNVSFDGELSGFFTGGIVAVNYRSNTITSLNAGSGALSTECKINSRRIFPTDYVTYTGFVNWSNLSLSAKAMEYLLNTNNKYYTYALQDSNIDLVTGNISLEDVTEVGGVLGMIVGLSFDDIAVKSMPVTDGCYQIKISNDKQFIIFNNDETSLQLAPSETDYLLLKGSSELFCGKMKGQELKLDAYKSDVTKVLYIIGGITDGFNGCSKYSDYYIFINPKPATRPVASSGATE